MNTKRPLEAEAVLDRMIEAVPGGVVYVGTDGAVLRANLAATTFLGLSYDVLTERFTQDFAGETWLEDGRRCDVGDYPVTQALVNRVPAGPTTIGVQQPSGEVRWAVFRAVPVDHGGAVVTFLDITERMSTERRLRTSDRLASLGRLAAGVAHEVNNPLTWVMLNLERALHDNPGDAFIPTALDGLERVAAIVRDLGALSRVDNPEPKPFDIHSAIEQAVSISTPESRHRAVVAVRPGPDVPPAMGIESRAVQVVLNLLLNAVQSIKPGHRGENRVVVSTSAANDHVVVEVEDTGEGMDPHVLEHALDPFFTTKDPGAGTGLGLAISHSLVRAMGGELTLESIVDVGTRARFSLPAATTPVVVPAPAEAPTELKPLQILVVDDEPEIGQMLAWALRPNEVTLLRNGCEALAHLQAHHSDVVICDLMMPEVTGMALHAKLAETHPHLLPRILFVTGGAFTNEARDFLNRPEVRYLSKPFRVNQVREAVAALLADA